MTHPTICIGAGPAGLTAAYLLSKQGKPVIVLEKDAHYVGGISRTVRYKNFGFDIGGHRFFSKSDEVTALWDEILGDDFLERPRKSRIYYGKRFYPYPLNLIQTLRNLGIIESGLCVLSYLRARIFPRRNVKSFEDWVVNQFGERLYRTFFKTYTEKVWGMPCNTISADWAAQRIKGLSMTSAVWNAIAPKKKNPTIKTLIDRFRYPRKGPGMMWEAAASKIKAQGGTIIMGAEVIGILKQEGAMVVRYKDSAGDVHSVLAAHVISSMPLGEIIPALAPSLPQTAINAAKQLKYRDFLIVALVVHDHHIFDDNWIYIHDPSVKVGRIQNFKSWSPEMVPDDSLNCYGMEYFCFAGDGLWNSADDELIRFASRELVALGLAKPEHIIEGHVVRQPKAYPVYDDHYKENVATIRSALDAHFANLHAVGRAGMHKYNNQDHAMMTAMLSVENILAGYAKYDVWQVNQDAEYHESARVVPEKIDR